MRQDLGTGTVLSTKYELVLSTKHDIVLYGSQLHRVAGSITDTSDGPSH